MIKICVFDPRLENRNKILSNVQAAVKNLAINVIFREENKRNLYYLKDKTFNTPLIMINGNVKSSGRIPDIEEITKWLEVKKIKIC